MTALPSKSDEIRVGWRVAVKGSMEVGTVLARDPETYICTVSWPQGQTRIHEMYLERVITGKLLWT